MHLVGQVAPLFKTTSYDPKSKTHTVTELSKLTQENKWVLLFFYPLDFSSLCPIELRELSEYQSDFKSLNTEVLTVSIDSPYSHEAWVEKDLKDFPYTMLSDITKRLSRDYGVHDEVKGVALRGTFIVDPEGYVQHHQCNNLNTKRSSSHLIETLKEVQKQYESKK
jgi:alkyl hydroperoxide reductase subunit AhpC